MSSDNIEEDFSKFVREVESELSRALIAAYGPEVGREAARDALVYAWEHWERVSAMENPVGYLYRVGQSKSRRHRRTRILFPEVDSGALPHVEPALPEALFMPPVDSQTVRSLRFIGSLPLVVSTIVGAWLGGGLAEPLLAAITLTVLAGYWLVSARTGQRRQSDRWFFADALPFRSGVWIWRFFEFAVLLVIALNWQAAMSIGMAGVAGARALWGSSGLVPAIPLLKEELLHQGSNDGGA